MNAPCTKSTILKCAAFSVIAVVIINLVIPSQITTTLKRWWETERLSDYIQAVSSRSSKNNVIILTMVDYSYRDMALNFYETSLKKHNIRNFLFIGNGEKLCIFLREKSLPCFVYTNDSDSDSQSMFGTKSFIKKMNIRTDMMLQALKGGFTVLHTDSDVVFLRNPMPDLESILKTYDMAIMFDHIVYNPGFCIAKPTNFTIRLYEEIKNITTSSPETEDLSAMNTALKKVEKTHPQLLFAALDKHKYSGGMDYYELGNRHFPSVCPECVVVHNTWIVSREAKIYRFKEHLTWFYEEDFYYSSEDRNYMSYNNPVLSSSDTSEEEIVALKAALAIARMLNRTVVLPRFHCAGKECPLNSLLSIAAFDGVFKGCYRESSFFSHPWVPESVKKSYSFNKNQSSRVILTGSSKNSQFLTLLNQLNSKKYVKFDFSENKDVSEDKIIRHFNNCTDRVIDFAFLYGLNPRFTNARDQTKFDEDIRRSFVRKAYRQL